MKGKHSGDRWLQIGATLFESEAFRTLPGKPLKLFIDMRTHYFGNNNGRLVVTLRAFVRRGWNSTSQLLKARDELLRRGLIRRTKYNGPNTFHRATLYAFTDLPTAESEKHGIVGATASHAYMNWTAASVISVFRQEETNVSAGRKDTSPLGGKRRLQTSPLGGKRSNARKPAPILAETAIQADSARFPTGGDISSSTSVMRASAPAKGLNGSHPVKPPSPQVETKEKGPRASRTKA